ncbi:hypothetical protein D7X30_20855 [Corallococcus sp. AB011P]|uniref:C80 family cysteine peptidase n=1 Tax=Corallococcus sp. AB011P TaxID=2316735 RepID=UPI000EA2A976|nr:C80 family cysteine peptidase [Corallococcus sp. AB011P]RKG57191.1 hypothetical protein D7X30_20855 [Corallococcus sp. AB011P]
MYLHDFQCPSCLSYFNEITESPYPSGDKWCSGCGVSAPHDSTYLLVSRVPDTPQVQQPFGFTPPQQQPTQQVLAPVSRYDRQLVVKFTNTSNYKPVDDAGTALHNKAQSKGLPSDIIELDPQAGSISQELNQKFGALTNKSRLYLVGHGQGTTVQGVNAFNLAYAVVHTWGAKAALRVTLVSCKAGEKVDTESVNFAKDFHNYLWKPCRLATEVAAYTRSVSVATAEFAKHKGMPHLEGRKAFYLDNDNIDWMVNDADQVKVVWYWNSNRTQQLSRNRSQDRAGRKD